MQRLLRFNPDIAEIGSPARSRIGRERPLADIPPLDHVSAYDIRQS